MSEKDFLGKSITKASLSRRSFLKWSAALGGAVALGGGISHGLKVMDKVAEAAVQKSEQGKWISANCWADCGSRGFNRVYVKDGTILRQGTDNTHPDSPDFPQVRSCAKGRSLRQMVFGADRLKYPMKRKNWEPGGGKKELRGRDEWVRISWEEALDYVAAEIERIKKKYGNESILITGYVYSLFGQWDVGRMLKLYGGFMTNWGACSSGAWGKSALMGLAEDFNDRMDLRKSDLIVLWGSNPAWSRAGLPTYSYMQMKKAGAKFISVDPFYNATAQVLADEWIPVRPGTDHALILGMAHTLITEDDPIKTPLIDWDFLNRCTVGFDADHMPEGVDPKENFRDYVLGTFDGEQKTAEWASEICGVPAHKIRVFAKEIASTNKVAICMSPAPARTTNGDSFTQAMMTLGAMTGHIGKSGSMVGSDFGHHWLTEGKSLAIGGNIQGDPTWFTPGGKEWIHNPIGGTGGMYNRPEKPFTRINNNELWSAILTGKYTAGIDDIRDCNIQLIYNVHDNHLNQAPGTMKGIEAFRNVEFVVTQNLVLATPAKYSDIVLPVTSKWEQYGDLTQGYREMIIWSDQVTEPLFEARDDIWIAVELAKRLGVDPKVVEPYGHKQEAFNQIAAASVIKEDGQTYEPLVTITEEDIKELGVDGKPQQGRLPIKQFKEQGIYQVPRSPDDNYGHIVYEAFRNDPELNPLGTKTGKFEIHSNTYADYVNNCGWSKIEPIPVYKPNIEGYEATFDDWKSKVKGKFPLQLITLHIPRHAHSTFANVPVLRESCPHVLYMNPIDAQERGLMTGDTALVTSLHGKVLRPVQITNAMMPGVVGLGQGAWVEIDDETGIDLAGCTNVLCGANAVGQGHQAWNSTILQVEKWTGKPLEPDDKWQQRIVFKEERK